MDDDSNWLTTGIAIIGAVATVASTYFVFDLACNGAITRWVDRQLSAVKRLIEAERDARKAEAHAVFEAIEIVDGADGA